jgi:hypothetical protein
MSFLLLFYDQTLKKSRIEEVDIYKATCLNKKVSPILDMPCLKLS